MHIYTISKCIEEFTYLEKQKKLIIWKEAKEVLTSNYPAL